MHIYVGLECFECIPVAINISRPVMNPFLATLMPSLKLSQPAISSQMLKHSVQTQNIEGLEVWKVQPNNN